MVHISTLIPNAKFSIREAEKKNINNFNIEAKKIVSCNLDEARLTLLDLSLRR